jgi:Kae1-associated kinase Bud32
MLKKVEIGDMIKKYEITDLIGEGGMGAVYKGRDTILDRIVAIKLIKPKEEDDNIPFEAYQRFFSEAKTLAKINHHSITTIYDIDVDTEIPSIVMEYLEGTSLKEYIETHVIETDFIVNVLITISEALCYAHEKDIIHRDIKPTNIFITTDGRVKILDFGIAKSKDDINQYETLSNEYIGSMAYTPPEVFQFVEQSELTDIYALGLTLLTCMIGEHPFHSETTKEMMYEICNSDLKVPRSTARKYDKRLVELLKKMAHRDPKARVQTMKEVFKEIGDIAALERSGIYKLGDKTKRTIIRKVDEPTTTGHYRSREELDKGNSILFGLITAFSAVIIAISIFFYQENYVESSHDFHNKELADAYIEAKENGTYGGFQKDIVFIDQTYQKLLNEKVIKADSHLSNDMERNIFPKILEHIEEGNDKDAKLAILKVKNALLEAKISSSSKRVPTQSK